MGNKAECQPADCPKFQVPDLLKGNTNSDMSADPLA